MARVTVLRHASLRDTKTNAVRLNPRFDSCLSGGTGPASGETVWVGARPAAFTMGLDRRCRDPAPGVCSRIEGAFVVGREFAGCSDGWGGMRMFGYAGTEGLVCWSSPLCDVDAFRGDIPLPNGHSEGAAIQTFRSCGTSGSVTIWCISGPAPQPVGTYRASGHGSDFGATAKRQSTHQRANVLSGDTNISLALLPDEEPGDKVRSAGTFLVRRRGRIPQARDRG